jgi:AcrR family transcriptional regulator
MALADAHGLDKVSMRKLGAEMGVEAMSLYNHVRDKDDLFDGMVDLVFGEIELPSPELPWREAMRRRTASARQVLRAHPWAIGLMESRRNPGPATLGHHDAVLGCLRAGGLSIELTAHAYALIDSYLYGFALQESTLPFETGPDTADLASQILDGAPADAYPNLAEFTTEHVLRSGYDFGAEFEIGLDLILGALEGAASG